MATKILAPTDALGNLMRFVLLPGHRLNPAGLPPLINGPGLEPLIADLNEHGAKNRHHSASAQNQKKSINEDMYKRRHLTDNLFCKLKEFKRIAMRTDNTAQNFNVNIQPKAAIIDPR